MHVVIVDEELPYPPNSGKRIRSLNLAIHLARRHKITYLCHRNTDPSELDQAVRFFREQGIDTILVKRTAPARSGLGFYARLVGNLLSPLPYSVQSHTSRQLRRAIQDYSASHRVDLWHCEWTPYGESLRDVVGSPVVVMAHNVESQIWQRYYETERNAAKRWYIKRQWRKFERFERQIFTTSALVVTVSQADACLARNHFAAPQVEVVDNGVDVGYFSPAETPRDHGRILFLGSLDWRPNLDAARILLDHIFPRVVASHPSARLWIVGRKPPAWLVERVKGSGNIELHADVPDVRPFLRQCGLLVVPLRIGGGSRLKILEALATECPVVSTSVGAEGLVLKPGEHFVQADEPKALAGAVLRCIRDPQPAVEMARRGRRVVVERYNWVVLAQKLEAAWRQAITTASIANRVAVPAH